MANDEECEEKNDTRRKGCRWWCDEEVKEAISQKMYTM